MAKESSGEEWKKEFSVTVQTYYQLQYDLCMSIVTFPASKAGKLEEIIDLFRPRGARVHDWRDRCYDAGIDKWVNTDPVFRLIDKERIYLDGERENVFYRGSVDEAMRYGNWPEELKAKARQMDKKNVK